MSERTNADDLYDSMGMARRRETEAANDYNRLQKERDVAICSEFKGLLDKWVKGMKWDEIHYLLKKTWNERVNRGRNLDTTPFDEDDLNEN